MHLCTHFTYIISGAKGGMNTRNLRNFFCLDLCNTIYLSLEPVDDTTVLQREKCMGHHQNLEE